MKRFLLLPFLLVLVVAGVAQNKDAASKPTHPEIDNLRQCSECHDAESKDWQTSKHGEGTVTCFICHGSVGENFAAKPTTERCIACHNAQAANHPKRASKARKATAKSCFDCHSPHTLHALAARMGGHK